MKTKIYLLLIVCIFTSIHIYSQSWAEGRTEYEYSSSFSNPLQINFQFNKSGTDTLKIDSCIWDFGDGTTKRGRWTKTSHTFSKVGNYNVCLLIQGYDSSFDSHCKTITVNSKPYADHKSESFIKFSTSVGGNNVNFLNTCPLDSPYFKYFWDFGDGMTASNHSPYHTFKKAGMYLVKLQVIDQLRNKVYTFADIVKVGTPPCNAKFEYYIEPKTNKVIFGDYSSSNIDIVFWWYGDGYYNVTDPTSNLYISHKYNPGIYDAYMVAWDSNGVGCIDYFTEKIRIGNIQCDASFLYYVDSISNTVYFRNNSLGSNDKLNWVFGDGSTSEQSNPIHQFKKSGYFSVSLMSKSGTCLDSKKQNILIGKEDLDCQADFEYVVYGISNVQFKNMSFGSGLSYHWDFGNGDTSNLENPEYIYDTKGGYPTVCLTIRKGNIVNTNCKKITVSPSIANNCFADFVYVLDSATQLVTFTNKSLNANEYSWDFGDGIKSTAVNPTHTYSDSGYFKVKLKAHSIANPINENNSYQYALIKIGKKKNQIKAAFGAAPFENSGLKASGYPVEFVGIAHGDAAKLKWSFGDGTVDSTTNNPIHEYQTPPDVYNVCYYIFDQITGESDTSCSLINVKQLSENNEIESSILNNDGFEMTVFPNPSSEFATINYVLEENAMIELSLLKSDGTLVKTLVKSTKNKGQNTLVLNTSKLTNGFYVIQLKYGLKISNRILIVN